MAEPFEVRAVHRHAPIAAQKARLVVNEVRGKDAADALNMLRFMPQKAADFVYKLIRSAVANAEENFGLEEDELYVSRIFVDDRPRRPKGRFGGRFAGRGRFRRQIRRSSHITVVLAEREVIEYGDF